MKIGIYGGTFDPPHIGHLNAAETARSQLGIDKLVLIPAGIPPHKRLQVSSASGEDRLAMVKLAAEHLKGAQVSDTEIKREGKSFTADTVREIKEANPDDDIYLFIGTDMLMIFEEWHEFQSIFAVCTLAVFAREKDDRRKIEEKAARLRAEFGARIEIIDNIAVSISSTELRGLLADRQGTEYLTREVYGYILSRKLYGARANFDYLRTSAYAMLKDSRTRHVAGCEYEAVRLAKRWGADENDAREAGILHDITKKLDLNSQLILCGKYGIMTDMVESKDSKLLHSKTGAALARDCFGVNDSVYGAIFWHTTGRAGMTLLEKIIYLADYIEPTRDFDADGLEKLRKQAYTDIDAAVLLGLEMSIEDLEERGIKPHPKTQEAIDWLRERN